MSALYPKPPILAQLSPQRHAVVEASAGTGKTYTLEHLVVELLLSTSTTLPEILVVTFTERAAGELKLRLRQKLRALLDARGETTPGAAWTLDQEARARIDAALYAFDAASISTIHAFCQRVLTEQAFATRRLFEQTLVDGRAAFGRAFLGVLRSGVGADPELLTFLRSWLEERRLAELERKLWACLERRGRLWPPYAPQALADAARALGQELPSGLQLEMELRKTELAGQTRKAVRSRWELLAEILQRYAAHGQVARLLVDLDRQERAHKGNGFVRYLSRSLGPVRRASPRLLSLARAVEGLEQQRVSLDGAVMQSFLPLIQRTLGEEKARRGELDFDDMLSMLAAALQGPSGPGLVSLLRGRFRYAVVDEFQDTDQVQWSIFQQIFLDSRDSQRLYLIGDPKQAIYAFRGADVYTYLEATRALEAAGADRVHLEENHRSTRPLVQALNLLFDQGAPSPFFSGEIRYHHPVRAARQDGEAPCPVQVLELVPGEEPAGVPAIKATLGRRIAQEIRALGRGQRGPVVEPGEIYLLTRSANESREAAAHLARAGIATAFYKEEGLFQSEQAEHIRDLLAAIAEPERRHRRLRAYLTPFFAVPLESLEGCLELPAQHPLFVRLLAWKRLAEEKDYPRLFNAVLDESGLVRRELFARDNERALTNYLHIFELLLEEAARTRPTLDELLRLLHAFIDDRRRPEGENGNIQRLESDRSAVQIMTMHKAKGLEARVVFVYGGLEAPTQEEVWIYHQDGERRLALHKHEGDKEQIDRERAEEDQRLLYVALTRAAERIYLPYFAAESSLLRLSGAYRAVNQALARVLQQAPPGLFAVERLPVLAQRALVEPAVPTAPLAEWTVSAPPSEAGELERLEPLRHSRGGVAVTSYSKLKAAKGGYRPPEAEPAAEGVRDELEPEVDVVSAGEGVDLPGGPASGRFLHEVLELLPLETVRDAPSFEFWSARQDVRALFSRSLLRHDRPLLALRSSMDLIWGAASASLPLAPGGHPRLEGGVARAQRCLREMEFLYPMPVSEHPPLDRAPGEERWSIARGFVKGFIDLLFEAEGRIYVLDWKSDLLPSYGADALSLHVAANYALQGQLYLLAVLRWLGIHDRVAYEQRFGGVLFCFVRGMRLPSRKREEPPGVSYSRPSWREVLEAERALAQGEGL